MNNEYVLITGCTSGIGYELALLFAKNKYNLVLVSRNLDKLNTLQEKIQNEYGVSVEVIAQDLSIFQSAQAIYQKINELGIDISILCNNAGNGLYGVFNEYELDEYHQMIQLNITTLMDLTYYFVKEMKIKNKGKILNIASTGSFVPGPYMAVYYATKAFVLSFSEAIAMELKNTSVTVTCICPGSTKTEFFTKATHDNINLIENMKTMSSKEVAKYAYDKLMSGKIVGIPGIKNKIVIFGNRFISKKVSRKIIYNIQYKRGKGKIK